MRLPRTIEFLLLTLFAVILTASVAAASPESSPPTDPVATPDSKSATGLQPTSLTPSETNKTPSADAASLEETDVSEDLRRLIAEVSERIAGATAGSPEADAADVALVAAIRQQQGALDAALRRLGTFGGAPETDPRWQMVALHGDALLQLVRLRMSAADKVSDERKHALFSVGREGFRQLLGETRTVWLAARFHLARRQHSLEEAPKLVRDVFVLGTAITQFVLVGLVLTAAFWVRSRWRLWLEQFHALTFRSMSRIASKRRVQRLLGALEIILPWTLFLLTIAALRRALGTIAEAPEVAILLIVLTVFGLYRLAIDIVAATLVSVAVHYGLDATDERRTMLLRSVRSVFRVGTALVLITLASNGLGQGFLSSLILKLGWIVIVTSILIELFRWRAVMIDTFLKVQPTGRLSVLVRATRSRWFGALIAPAAFVWLACRGVATVAREFALGFEQTQKALAFLFRQKVQRQAERQGYAEGDVEELPITVVEAFSEGSVDRGPLVVTDFPGLDTLQQIVSTWRLTGAQGSFLLSGERGIGKTTWLNQFRRDDVAISRITLGRRIIDANGLIVRLAELLEVDLAAGSSPRDLANILLEGPKRVVVIDMAQHLFLAAVGGYDAFNAFATLVNRTCRNIFWLCSMSGYAWHHLAAVRPDATVFRTRQHLGGWSDARIAALIATRCAASGVRFDYADLVVDSLEGVSVRSRLIESQEGYTRLLWDYSDGNPRAALHFFLRSLDPHGSGRVRVRLFKAPNVEILEAGGQDGLFVLAAIVVHESISLDDLEVVTRFNRAQCFIHLDRLQEIGAVVFDQEMYRISVTWHRAAVRLLRRRNMLPE